VHDLLAMSSTERIRDLAGDGKYVERAHRPARQTLSERGALDVVHDETRHRQPGQFLPHLLQVWEIGDYDRDDQDANLIVEEMRRSQQPRSARVRQSVRCSKTSYRGVNRPARGMSWLYQPLLMLIGRRLYATS